MDQAPKLAGKLRLADALLPDGLDAFIAVRRDQGESWRLISIAIRDEVDLDIHPETIRLHYSQAVA